MPKTQRTPPKAPALSYAVWLLSRREWAAKELFDRLVQRGYPVVDARAAISTCTQNNYLSDERFAQARVRSRGARYGDRRVAAELTVKGVTAATIEEALTTLEPEQDRALQALNRFDGKPFGTDVEQKAWRYLLARGFDSSAVAYAIKQFKKSRADASP